MAGHGVPGHLQRAISAQREQVWGDEPLDLISLSYLGRVIRLPYVDEHIHRPDDKHGWVVIAHLVTHGLDGHLRLARSSRPDQSEDNPGAELIPDVPGLYRPRRVVVG